MSICPAAVTVTSCPATYRSDCGQVTALCLSFLLCDLGCHLLERMGGGGNVLLEGLLAEGAWSWCRGLGAGASPFPSGGACGLRPCTPAALLAMWTCRIDPGGLNQGLQGEVSCGGSLLCRQLRRLPPPPPFPPGGGFPGLSATRVGWAGSLLVCPCPSQHLTSQLLPL